MPRLHQSLCSSAGVCRSAGPEELWWSQPEHPADVCGSPQLGMRLLLVYCLKATGDQKNEKGSVFSVSAATYLTFMRDEITRAIEAEPGQDEPRRPLLLSWSTSVLLLNPPPAAEAGSDPLDPLLGGL